MTRRRSAGARLYDALQAAKTAQTYLGNVDVIRFRQDDQLRSAIYWQLMVIGEALNQGVREEPAIRSELPMLTEVIGLRNRIVHGYDEIDDDVIWRILTRQLPPLISVLDRLLASRPPPED